MDLIEESFKRLFPQREFYYQTELSYNRRLGNFNANISMFHNKIKIKLNLQWRGIDNEIKIGLIQCLLLRILRNKSGHDTLNIELYNHFIKQIPLMTPKVKNDPLLEASFERVNQQFLQGLLEKPNLQWGRLAFRKLAHYNFHDDSITISLIFQDAPSQVLDYIMYHELLHKHLKFKHKNGRSYFHSYEFKNAEAQYPLQKEVEIEMKQIIQSKLRMQKQGRHGF